MIKFDINKPPKKYKIMPIKDIKELLTKIERNYKKNLGVKK